jgi:outer membrane protein OmpA-like peptidoglycan-associated protein
MKKYQIQAIHLFLFTFSIGINHFSNAQLFNRIKNAVEQTAENHVVNDASNATNKTIDEIEHPGKSKTDSGSDIQSKGTSDAATSSADTNKDGNSTSNKKAVLPSINTYKNYDFVPGDTIIFADDFSDDQIGELPAHWYLCYGQGQVNDFDGKNVFILVSGEGGDAAAVLEARMKQKSGYMPSAFTVEFDMYAPFTSEDGDMRDPWVGLNFYGEESNPDELIRGYDDLDLASNKLGFFSGNLYQGQFELPDSTGNENFLNKWHHIALAYRDGQMKIYLDQNRIYVVPQVRTSPINKFAIRVSGKAMVTNIRVASGGGMKMLNKKFTEAKIVTHGITFDVNKAAIKPESMGTLNMIFKILINNPEFKFEIDGHTDNTGDATHNLSLSQQRADAVKEQLVKMGIQASRLTTKGFGDSKPISDNNSVEGRANNRRVEFVKVQ